MQLVILVTNVLFFFSHFLASFGRLHESWFERSVLVELSFMFVCVVPWYFARLVRGVEALGVPLAVKTQRLQLVVIVDTSWYLLVFLVCTCRSIGNCLV